MAHKAPHDVLSQCLERLESGQGGDEELLAQRPELRAELEPLLRLAGQLRAQPPLRAPDRLRHDPLWRRGLAPAAEAPASLRDFAAARATPATAHLEPHDALAVALERWERGEPGVDAVLSEHPDVEPLVELAVELWSMPPVQAPARLRQDPLWRRAATPAEQPVASVSLPLWAAARRDDVVPAARFASASQARRRQLVRTLSRLAAGVGGAGLALLLAGGLATSTATSLPDEPLYPVKRLVEDAQLAVAPPEARLEIRLQRAQERMKETREMVERARADVVASLATDYVREVDAVRTELQASQAQTPAPEQVGRVITRLEANEQMLGAIVQRVPEPARPAVARAVEVSRPENVASADAPTARPGAVAAPAAPEPAAVAPPAASEPPAPAAIVPNAAPTFGVPGPASVALPSRGQPQGGSGSAPAAAPGRVTIPGGTDSAPAILPSAGSATAPRQGPASTTGSASAGTTTAPGSVTTGSPSSGTASSTTGAPQAAPFGSAGAVTGSNPGASGPNSAASSPGSGTTSAPGSVTTGNASTGPATSPASTTGGAGPAAGSNPASTTGSQGTTSPSSTQRAPSFDALPAQAPPASASPTPVYQLLPPAATPTRATP